MEEAVRLYHVAASCFGTVGAHQGGRLVRDPQTGEKVGYAVNRLGSVEVTREVTDNTATAVILKSNEPIRVGDFVSLDE